MANDPKNKITDALTDAKERTDMLSIFVSKEQKRYDTHLVMGSKIYGIPNYDEMMLTDRRQQMAMKSKGTTPRSEQLKEAMIASNDKGGIYGGTRNMDEVMEMKRRRQDQG